MSKQDEMLGKVVRHFTTIESILRQTGSFIDNMIPLEDECSTEFKELISEMYFKLSSLISAADDFKTDISTYITSEAVSNDSVSES